MPKVLFVCLQATHLFFPEVDDVFGGAEVSTARLVQELAKSPDLSIHVLVRKAGEPCRESRGPLVVHAFDDRPRLVRWAPMVRALPIFWRFTRLLDAIDPDLVVHQGASHTAGYAALWARHRGRRSLFWVAHEIDVDGQYEAAAGPLLGWLHRRALALAAEVVCTTRRQQSLLDSRRPGRSSVLVRYGVQAGEADPGSQRVGALWVGRAAGFKRPSLFVDLARALPEVPFTMVLADNRDGEGLFDSIRSRAQGVPNLTLCPNLDHPSSVRAVARTRVLVSTSTQEGLPLVFLEALAAGTPVASLAFDPDGLLRDHGVFGCAGGSLESLARMVVQLTSDDALFAAVSRRALDLWRTELSLDVHVQRFRDVVGRVAPGR